MYVMCNVRVYYILYSIYRYLINLFYALLEPI